MLLTITTTRAPATDLGYLLHKHPDRPQSFATSAGEAHVFYPEATPERCTAALLLEVDPVALVRGHQGQSKNSDAELAQYVNDRPYAASSLLAVAIKEAFRTALTGRCDARPDLAAARIPLQIRVPALRCRGGTALAHRVFGPLGWHVAAKGQPLKPAEWGDSPYLDLRLTGELRLADALNHLYVLLPVLDDAKHYWVSTDEVDKLIRAGGDWLAGHPEKELITRRYLSHQQRLTRSALARLAEADDTEPEELDNAVTEEPEDEHKPLAVQRREAILAIIRQSGARRVGDLGCGAGVLTRDLLADSRIEHVTAVDVSARALQLAARHLKLDQMPDNKRQRLTIFQSSLTYRDDRLAGLDAAVLMEVIEHLDPDRIPALERVIFREAAPATVVVTTPNAEYNPHFETLPQVRCGTGTTASSGPAPSSAAGRRRAAGNHGYRVRFLPVGPEHPDAGPPTQLAVFDRGAETNERTEDPRAEPGRPGRRDRIWQVDVRPRALQADRGDLLGLLPRPGRRRRERPVRHPGRVRAAALHRSASASPAAASPSSTRPTCSPKPAASSSCWPASTTCCRWRSCLTCRRSCARSATPAARTGTSARTCSAVSAASCAAACTRLKREGFRTVHVLRTPEEVAAAAITRTRLFSDLRHEAGPFDVIGDVHGCRPELEQLLTELGYTLERDAAGRPVGARHPDGRRAIFVGDLVDRGPDTPGVLRLVMGMVAAGTAFCVAGNHEVKLLKALRGKNVRRSHGLDASMEQLDPRIRGVPGPGRALHRRPDRPLRAGRRAAGGGARRPDRALPRPRLRPGPRVLPVRADHRRDRRVRPAGALPVGAGIPGPGRRPVRPHPSAGRGVAEQHPVPGHRLCLRWPSDRVELSRTDHGVCPGGPCLPSPGEAFSRGFAFRYRLCRCLARA